MRKDGMKFVYKERIIMSKTADKSVSPIGFSNVQRDYYQSNGAGLISARERIAAEPNAGKVGWRSLQTAGGTFFHKPMMEGRDPWLEIQKLTDAYPDIERTMLVRGDVLTAYDIMPDDVIEHFMREHAKAGINTFTIFDGLDDFDNMREPIKWANRLREDEGFDAHAQGVICVGQSEAYTLDLYIALAEQLVEAGVRDLYIKDPCGVTLPDTMHELVTHLKRDFEVPVFMHTHDTHGLAIATYMAGFEAGADNADVAHPAVAGNVGQPSALRLLHAIEGSSFSERAPKLDTDAIMADYHSLLHMRMRLSDVEPKFDREVMEALYEALGPGGAASTLKPIMGENFRQVKGLDWQQAQIEIYDFQAKMLKALGEPLQVTPHAKNTTDTAGVSRFKDADPNDPTTWTLSKGTRQLLTGQSGKHPGTPCPVLVERALKEEGLDEVMTGRPADNLAPMMQEAREMLVAEAANIEKGLSDLKINWANANKQQIKQMRVAKALRNPSNADLVTVAMWNNAKKEGLTHVVKRISGELKQAPAPGNKIDELSRDAGLDTQTTNAILNAIGGATEIERVAQAVLELEKVGYYRTGYEDAENLSQEQQGRHNYLAKIYQDVEDEAEGVVSQFFAELPNALNDAGLKREKTGTVSFENAAFSLLQARSQNKGVTEETIDRARAIMQASTKRHLQIVPQDEMSVAQMA